MPYFPKKNKFYVIGSGGYVGVDPVIPTTPRLDIYWYQFYDAPAARLNTLSTDIPGSFDLLPSHGILIIRNTPGIMSGGLNAQLFVNRGPDPQSVNVNGCAYKEKLLDNNNFVICTFLFGEIPRPYSAPLFVLSEGFQGTGGFFQVDLGVNSDYPLYEIMTHLE